MEMKALHHHGWTVSALAREFGVCRDTVRRELRREGPAHYVREKPTNLMAAQLAHVERRLAACATIRGTDLHQELVDRYGYTGSYPSFQRQLRLFRPAVVREPEIRFETGPGDQAQTDWGHMGVWPVDGEARELFALVTILGYSRRPAVRFALDRTRTTTLTRLALTLDDLGGATNDVLSDRDPAFVIGSTSDGRAIFAPEWIDWAEVLGVVPKACRPYRAKTKGKVERMVREVKEGEFPGLADGACPAADGGPRRLRRAGRTVDPRARPAATPPHHRVGGGGRLGGGGGAAHAAARACHRGCHGAHHHGAPPGGGGHDPAPRGRTRPGA
jgi:transposase